MYSCITKSKEDETMLTFIALILFVAVFGRLLLFAIKLGWGIIKFVGFLVFLPAIILGLILTGIVSVAIPAMLVIGLISLAATA